MAKQIDKIEISDALIERPIGFTYRRRHFLIYPPTLGKIQLISRLLSSIGFDKLDKDGDVYPLILSAVATKREVCKRLLAYSTLPADKCLDEGLVRKQLRKLRWMREADLASMIMIAMTMDRSEEIMEHFGLDMEAKQLAKVMKVKSKNKNSLDFAGKSVWGTMIDSACERYGWTYQYVLWGISYCALKMLLSDQVKTVLLTDDERKNASIPKDRRIIDADNPELLNQFIKHTSWN